MPKVLYNRCYGGFGFSDKFVEEFNRLYPDAEKPLRDYDDDCAVRSDPRIIELFERMGTKEASGDYAELKVSAVPDGFEWSINEYDGMESVVTSIPYYEMIDELVAIVKGKKEASNQFIKRLLEEDNMSSQILYWKVIAECDYKQKKDPLK